MKILELLLFLFSVHACYRFKSQLSSKEMPLKLSPSVVAFTLVGLLSCSTTIFILVPPNLQGSRGVDNEGYFGKGTSEIDWCENNYVHTRYIAEFANSTTSLIYCLLAVFSYIESMEQLSKDPGAIKFQLLLVSLWSVGIGSTLFHGTLLYWAQLLDELPMVYLICSAGETISPYRGAYRYFILTRRFAPLYLPRRIHSFNSVEHPPHSRASQDWEALHFRLSAPHADHRSDCTGHPRTQRR